jgi:hypothetical protein
LILPPVFQENLPVGAFLEQATSKVHLMLEDFSKSK